VSISSRGSVVVDLLASPAVVITALTLMFSGGLYVGRSESRERVARLEVELQNHREIPAHAGALTADSVRIMFQDVSRRLDAIEKKLQ